MFLQIHNKLQLFVIENCISKLNFGFTILRNHMDYFLSNI